MCRELCDLEFHPRTKSPSRTTIVYTDDAARESSTIAQASLRVCGDENRAMEFSEDTNEYQA